MFDTKAIIKAGTNIAISAAGTAAALLLCQKGGAMLVKDGQPPTAVSEYGPAAVCLAGGTYLAATQDNEYVQAFATGIAIGGGVKLIHTVANKTKADTLKLGLGNVDTQYMPLADIDLGDAAGNYADDDDDDEDLSGADNVYELGTSGTSYELGGFIADYSDKCVA